MLSELIPRSFEVESISGRSDSCTSEYSGDLNFVVAPGLLFRAARHLHRGRRLRAQHGGLDFFVIRAQIGDERGFQFTFQFGQVAISRARLSASAIMRRDFSSRPATMVGASDG